MNKYIKNILLIITIFTYNETSYSASTSEIIAFCNDYISSKYFSNNYERQKYFNNCIENADLLIKNYEKKKKIQEEEDQKWRINNAKIRKEQEEKQKEQEKEKKLNEEKNRKDLIKNPFSEFERN